MIIRLFLFILISGIIIWRWGSLIIPFLQGCWIGLSIRAMVMFVRQVILDKGPDPYTEGILYYIQVELVTPLIHLLTDLISILIEPITEVICWLQNTGLFWCR